MVNDLDAYRRLCAGVYWLKHKNREEYARLMKAEVDPKAWSAEVQGAAANGLIVTEEFEPEAFA